MGLREIIVVGAGAAGLWAARRAAELGAQVLLLEKTARTGTKVLASGGTRCNLTTTLGPDDAARLFGAKGERFLRRAFRNLTPLGLRAWFEAAGVPTVEAPLEKVFPRSDRARDVRDALERRAIEAGVRIETGAAVEGIAHEAGTWIVHVGGGRSHRAPRLLLCPGGKSYPRTGTTGDGYGWLEALDLPVVPPVPALAPLRSPERWVHELTGLSVQEARVRLTDVDGRVLGRRERPVVFTHHGVSGPGAMDLSEPVARAVDEARRAGGGPPRFQLVVDLVPDLEREELRELLIRAAGARGAPRLSKALRAELGARVPRRLLAAVAAQAGIGADDPRVNELAKAARHGLVEGLRGLVVPIDGTLGFERAEVTAGGLDLGAVDPGTMRVRGRAGLWVFGELLDLAGPIGGLNFQAAFAAAELAAVDAVSGKDPLTV